MVFQKQLNKDGNYVDAMGERFDILSCERTESKQLRQVGTRTEIDEQGNEIEVPVMEPYIAINVGWDAFESEEAAAKAYGLTYSPIEPGEELDKTEEFD